MFCVVSVKFSQSQILTLYRGHPPCRECISCMEGIYFNSHNSSKQDGVYSFSFHKKSPLIDCLQSLMLHRCCLMQFSWLLYSSEPTNCISFLHPCLSPRVASLYKTFCSLSRQFRPYQYNTSFNQCLHPFISSIGELWNSRRLKWVPGAEGGLQ